MGVLNLTPDSFSDGGRFADIDTAVRSGMEMLAEGADILDLGGESTRPGAQPIAPELELERVIPVVEALRRQTDAPLSVDTSKAEVARQAIAAGANFINDISGLTFDPEMAAVAAESGAGLFLMHTRGRPAEMQRDTFYQDLCGEVMANLRAGLKHARAAGVAQQCLAVDPGIGFGKSVAGNLQLLQRIAEFHQLGYPLLLGTSRKSFIGKVLGLQEPLERLAGTLATVAWAVSQGVQLHRVHDVRPAREAALMAWAIREQQF
jgi:dihydropteroate synthase